MEQDHESPVAVECDENSCDQFLEQFSSQLEALQMHNCNLRVELNAVLAQRDEAIMVNCALEKTNQNLSDEICRLKEESDSDKKKIMQLQKQLRANDENRAANQATSAEKGGMFDGVAKIGRIAMRAFVNGSE